MNRLFLLIAFLFLQAAPCNAQSAKELFVVEHSTNSNRVYYEARVAADGLFDPRNPIHAFWVMWEKDPTGKTREELSLLENEKAFGFKVVQNPSRKFLWFTIVSVPGRPIKVSLQSGSPAAQTVIDGRFSFLEKIAISVATKNFLPHVNYIELFGRDGKNGGETYERIVNK